MISLTKKNVYNIKSNANSYYLLKKKSYNEIIEPEYNNLQNSNLNQS